jgi:hypothetical protein
LIASPVRSERPTQVGAEFVFIVTVPTNSEFFQCLTDNKPVVKEKKPRAKKEVVEGGEPKRGRKPKQQLVELAQDVSTNSVEEESLDMLIQSMNVKEASLEEIQVEDIDDMMRELEAEEIKEDNKPIEVVVDKPKKKIQKTKKTVVEK